MIETYHCEQCGEPFRRQASLIKNSKHKFCCMDHSNAWHKEQGWPSCIERKRIGRHRVENANCYLLQAQRMLEGKPVNKHCVELPETCL
jgi:hypothetical protein